MNGDNGVPEGLWPCGAFGFAAPASDDNGVYGGPPEGAPVEGGPVEGGPAGGPAGGIVE